jgi:hypothetical protein
MSATTLSRLTPEERLSFEMEQFKALRDEILTAIRGQVDILRFGSAILTLLLATAGAGTENRPILRALIFTLFAPTVAWMTLIMWSSEVFRMMRAAVFIHGVEEQLLEDDAGHLGWEHWAHKPGEPDIEQTHTWTIRVMFGLIAAGSIAYGEYVLFGVANVTQWVSIGLTLVVAATVVSSIVVLWRMDHELNRLCKVYGSRASRRAAPS